MTQTGGCRGGCLKIKTWILRGCVCMCVGGGGGDDMVGIMESLVI